MVSGRPASDVHGPWKPLREKTAFEPGPEGFEPTEHVHKKEEGTPARGEFPSHTLGTVGAPRAWRLGHSKRDARRRGWNTVGAPTRPAPRG